MQSTITQSWKPFSNVLLSCKLAGPLSPSTQATTHSSGPEFAGSSLSKAAAAKQALRELLAKYDPLAIAEVFQSTFNGLPSLDRDGYQCKVSLQSRDFQSGNYD